MFFPPAALGRAHSVFLAYPLSTVVSRDVEGGRRGKTMGQLQEGGGVEG